MNDIEHIAIVGAGRMGNAIAIAFAYAGRAVSVIDVKPRDEQQLIQFEGQWQANIQQEIQLLQQIEMINVEQATQLRSRIQFLHKDRASYDWKQVDLLIEAVPEVKTAKAELLHWLEPFIRSDCIVASTTSTFLVTEVAEMISHPERVINAHWLNPAYLMPLVELSRSEQTSAEVVEQVKNLFSQMGKVPIVCNAVAGYVVPRIQALAMNEAARMVEENVASAEDIDMAIRTGFGLRFSILGMLEFIDWGGGDILYHASDYLQQTLGERYQAPDIIQENMRSNRNGLRELQGFYDYRDCDVQAYKLSVIRQFARQLKFNQLAPGYGVLNH